MTCEAVTLDGLYARMQREAAGRVAKMLFLTADQVARARADKGAAHALAREAIARRRTADMPVAAVAGNRGQARVMLPLVRRAMRGCFRDRGAYTRDIAATVGAPTKVVVEALYLLERDGVVRRLPKEGGHLKQLRWALAEAA